jgi:hypothetical protein
LESQSSHIDPHPENQSAEDEPKAPEEKPEKIMLGGGAMPKSIAPVKKINAVRYSGIKPVAQSERMTRVKAAALFSAGVRNDGWNMASINPRPNAVRTANDLIFIFMSSEARTSGVPTTFLSKIEYFHGTIQRLLHLIIEPD